MRNIIWKIASVYHTVKVKVKSLSCVRLFATPWTVEPTRLRHPWDFPGKNTGVGCHFLLQGIFTTQGSNPGLLHCRETVWATREADLLVTQYHQFLCFYYGSESFIILFAEFSRTQNLSVGFPRFICSLFFPSLLIPWILSSVYMSSISVYMRIISRFLSLVYFPRNSRSCLSTLHLYLDVLSTSNPTSSKLNLWSSLSIFFLKVL